MRRGGGSLSRNRPMHLKSRTAKSADDEPAGPGEDYADVFKSDADDFESTEVQ